MKVEVYAASEAHGSRLIVDGQDWTDRTTSLVVRVEVGRPTEVHWTAYPEKPWEGIPEVSGYRVLPDELVMELPDRD